MTAEGLDAAFRKASELAATFQANESRYLSADYQEAEARKDFIDKFFIALGWDVNHDVQHNPYAQEVKVEVAHGSSQRRADYAFYIAPNFGDSDVRFYVEAKKPHCNIATADNYFQTIRYGSGSRTPLAVLTDFEQFHVLDSRFKADICRSLSDEYSPYNFATIPIPILGSIYERFLGKIIVATDKRVRVEEKPEVRKAGGVYYTPEYIVRYIVENTVGKLIAGKTPDQIAEMHFADIACGSGSFLLGIYDLLLQYHGNYYNALTGEQRFNCYLRGDCIERDGRLFLSLRKKRDILLNNIYGVDIDAQAVEVTQLSLYLKLLQEETASVRDQLEFRETLLPPLNKNIVCGNSLIGTDILEGQLFPGDEERKLNPMNFEDAFPRIFGRRKATVREGGEPYSAARNLGREGGRRVYPATVEDESRGFDAVIGNPPYVLLQDEFRDDTQLAYFRCKYAVASYKVDTYHLFMERGIRLTKRGGRCSMITPANFLTNNYLAALRRFMLEHSVIDHILVADGGVFHGISVDNAIFVVKAGEATDESFAVIHSTPEASSLREDSRMLISVSEALKQPQVLFTGQRDGKQSVLWGRSQQVSMPLKAVAYVNFGKQLRDRKKFTRDVIEVASAQDIPKGYRPCYTGRDVSRYGIGWGKLACMNSNVARQGGCWDANRQDAKNKLVTRQIGVYPEFGLDQLGYQCLNTVFMVNI